MNRTSALSSNRYLSTPVATSRKRAVLYARVSTQEQTKGLYPSCDSQIEELEAFCKSKSWDVFEKIKDEGHRAGTLKRPGLTRLRWLVETEQIDIVICTWYNRLIGSRDFYVLDKEFKTHKVSFMTVHDPADRHTASGRLLESMLVTIKTFENEQIGEKVRTKMRMRAEKGLWNGGIVPFGFTCEETTQVLRPNPEQVPLLPQIFQKYVDTQSDFAVRDWLKAHNIPAPGGKAEWTPSTIRDLLMNRRYIAEIEINKQNKGIEDVPELEYYRILPAPHEPLVSRELFELAQVVRANRAALSPHRGGKGKGHNYSNNQCQRVYLLQSNLVCGICGAAMTPHYVYHKPNEKEKRKTASYIYHYTCAHKMKYRQAVKHGNRVLARLAENWALDAIKHLVMTDGVLTDAIAVATQRSESELGPEKEALAQCQRALNNNQQEIDELVETAKSARGALLDLLAEKAHALKLEREKLKSENRSLQEKLATTNRQFDETRFRKSIGDFTLIREKATPEELQRLLRLTVRKIEWMPDQAHKVQFYLADAHWKDENHFSNGSNGSRLEWSGQ